MSPVRPLLRVAVGVFLLSSSAAVPTQALDPHKAITQYWIDSWSIKDGLPGHSIRDIEQTRDGYLWLATQGGLLRFDGVTFKVFDETSVPDFKQSVVWSLFASRQGGLWAGVYGAGVLHYKDGRLRSVPVGPLQPTWPGSATPLGNVVVHEAPDGRLWVGVNDSLIRLGDGGQDYRAKVELVRALLAEEDGTVWAGTWSDGLARLRSGEVVRFGPEQGLDVMHIQALCRARDGTLWIGGRQGLTALRNGRFTRYTAKDGFVDEEEVKSLLEDRDGNLWIGTANRGLYRFQGGVFSVRRRVHGLSDDEISALHEDDEGGLWIGARGALNRLRSTSFTTFTAEEGLPTDAIVQARPARDGGLWISTYGGGLVHLKDGRFTPYDGRSGLPNLYVGAIHEASDGDLWMGVGSNELCRLRDGRITTFETGKRYVKAIGEDERGLLIALSRSGLHRLEEGRLVAYRTEAGEEIRYRYINAIHQARDGSLWIAASEGLASVRGGRLRVHDARDGLPADEVYSLHEDDDGTMWLGTARGLVRVKDGRFTRYAGQPGLDETSIVTMLADRSGNLWLNSNKGVLRVARADLHAQAEGRLAHVVPRVFDSHDGLKLVELRGPTVLRAAQTADGRMWFPTPRGLAMVDPQGLSTVSRIPPVLIERVVMDGKAIEPREGVEVPAGTAKIEMHYTALTYTVPERASFRYRLEGFDRDWVDAGPRRVAHYTKLPPGRYRFQVRAANRDGVWNETGASLSLSQKPRLHQTLWFQLLGLSGVGLSILAGHRFRVRRLTADIERRKQVELALRRAEEEYRSIFENAVEGIFRSTPDGRLLRANPALARMLGYGSPVELLAAVTDVARQLHVDPDRHRAMLRQAGEEGVVQGFECELRRQDGGTLWASINVQAMRDRTDGTVFLEGTAEDITDRRRAQELQESLRRSESMSAMGALVAGVAHEVRNPLFAISANLDALEAQVGPQPEFSASVAPIRSAVDRLTTLMQDLLNYGKPAPVTPTPGSIDAVVKEAVDSCSSLATAREVQLVNGGLSSLPPVVMDRKRLGMVLQNLLQNAIEYSPKGGVVRVVTAREEDESGCRAVLRVEDSGPGFPPEDLPHIFEPFFSRRRGGTGLGLAIAQRIVEEHHGTLSAANRPEGGAAMTVKVPCPR